jgi:hypothetical protein
MSAKALLVVIESCIFRGCDTICILKLWQRSGLNLSDSTSRSRVIGPASGQSARTDRGPLIHLEDGASISPDCGNDISPRDALKILAGTSSEPDEFRLSR